MVSEDFEWNTMNIFALHGHKVKVTERTKNNGYQFDRENVAKHLEIEKPYTIDHTHVDNSSTRVFLVEFPEKNGRRPSFNSVNFVDVVPQSKEDNEKHPDWIRYNASRKRFSGN
jgi:hypothetical protein